MTVVKLCPRGDGIPDPPPDRGRLLAPDDLAAMLGVSPMWARKHIPHKLSLGHRTVRWYEYDVMAWLESNREAG